MTSQFSSAYKQSGVLNPFRNSCDWRSPITDNKTRSPESVEEDMDQDYSEIDSEASLSSSFLWSRSSARTEHTNMEWETASTANNMPNCSTDFIAESCSQLTMPLFDIKLSDSSQHWVMKCDQDTVNLSASNERNSPAPSWRRQSYLHPHSLPSFHTTTRNSVVGSEKKIVDEINSMAADKSEHDSIDENNLSSTQYNKKIESRKSDEGETKYSKVGSCCCTGQCMLLLLAIVIVGVAIIIHFAGQPCVNEIDLDSLHQELNRRVYGQHLAINAIMTALRQFVADQNKNLLVMSLHGWTGVGKNFVSSILASRLHPSQTCKLIIPLHFAHSAGVDTAQLNNWMFKNRSSSCALQLFIIDEIDKLSLALSESLHASIIMLKEQSQVQRQCRTVVMLLSNDGAAKLTSYVADRLVNGETRENIMIDDINLKPTLPWLDDLISSSVVDFIVPFLPLERRHISMCIETELKQRNHLASQELIDEVLAQVQFYPADTKLFAKAGCRKVSYLVDLVMYN